MANIFNKTNNLYENPKRNTFDLSFQNNLTLNMGELVPVFCKECIPGDSFKIDPTISLRMMPLLFPVQTRLRAHLHFFYVTNRSLWKDWQDFIGNTRQSLNLPYITPQDDFKTGKLADYLGIPTTVVSGTPTLSNIKYFSGTYSNVISSSQNGDGASSYSFSLSPNFSEYPTPIIYDALSLDDSFSWKDFWRIFNDVNGALGISGTNGHNIASIPRTSSRDTRDVGRNDPNNIITNLTGQLLITPRATRSLRNILYYAPTVPKSQITSTGELSDYIDFGFTEIFHQDDLSDFHASGGFELIFKSNHSDSSKDRLLRLRRYLNENTTLRFSVDELLDSTIINGSSIVSTGITWNEFVKDADNIELAVIITNIPSNIVIDNHGVSGPPPIFGSLNISNTSNGSVMSFTLSESYGTSPIYTLSTEPKEILDNESNVYQDDIRVSALPWRAYEAIYNSFYRDERNNPLLVNGEPVYNKFLRNYDGGHDNVVNRELYKRNWESDFLTTAVQSPQQGVAPLVGITVNGEISFKDVDTGEIYSAKLNSSDGDKIDNFTVTSSNMPNANLRQLVDFASSGISISDLRGVNALQRWLEINMRRGLRYKDQIMSHFGVNVHYDELMMPEFIGGMSTDIYINQINQTTPTAGSPLGSFAGQGGAFGSSSHSINHYCQEHGYIIGILSISPTPQYSQLLPKHFLKRELLDFFFPEFGHLGMQPISYKEVAPNESYATGQSLDDVFGYQRAWYDYLASVDEVHGLFRTNLNNFVVQRYFDGRPDLSPDFLTIDPKTLDSVFSVNAGDDSHKFLGQVYFDCKVKRPIPEYGVPRLEV